MPCLVSHRVNPPPPSARWVQGGVHQKNVSHEEEEWEGGAEVRPPPNICQKDGRPLIRAWLRVAIPSVLTLPCATVS